MPRVDGWIVVIEVSIATSQPWKLVSDDVAECRANNSIIFRWLQQAANKQIDVVRRLVNFFKSLSNWWAELVEIFNWFSSIHREIIVVWPQGFITTTLNIERNQIEAEGISSTEQEAWKLREKRFKSKSRKIIFISLQTWLSCRPIASAGAP